MGETVADQKRRCEKCGLAMPENAPKGEYKYFCTNDGKRRRGGDSCKNFWGKEDMKRCLDEVAKLAKGQ